MALIHTTKGLLDRDSLELEDIIEEGDGFRSIATEWRLDGELVRRDVAVSILHGQSLTGEQEAVG